MKSYIAAAALLAVVNAQSISDAPACVQTCVNNMLGKATELGCASATDVVCLCANVNFGYGVRDCSSAVCQNAADVQTGLALLQSAYCASGASSASAAGSSVSSLSAVGSSVLAGVSSIPVSTEGSYTTIVTDGSTITSLVSASNTLYGFVTIGTDSAGSAYTSTITGAAPFVTTGTNSDGSTYTSTLTGAAASSAESAAAAASSGASSGASSASESISSVASDASASLSSAVASASSEASSRVSSASDAAGSATSSSSGGAAVPMATMAANGIVGLAGLAAVMLL